MAPYRPDIASDEQLNGMLPRAYRHVTGRSDGWTPQVRQAFLASLAADGSVQQAAKDVGRHFTSAYRLRARDAVFRAAWDAAIAMAYARLRDEAMERALNGVMVDRFKDDRFVGQERRYNDRLLMFLLDHLGRHGAVAAAGPADAFGLQFERLLAEATPKRRG